MPILKKRTVGKIFFGFFTIRALPSLALAILPRPPFAPLVFSGTTEQTRFFLAFSSTYLVSLEITSGTRLEQGQKKLNRIMALSCSTRFFALFLRHITGRGSV